MALRSTALAVAGLVALSTSAVALDGGGIAGDYGDAAGRLGCAADGEFLTFTEDGRVELREGPDRPAVRVATYELDASSSIIVSLTDPAGHNITLQPAGGQLTMVDYSVDGISDPNSLETWSSRHGGAFVPCDGPSA